MTRFAPYLSAEYIERDATALLTEFSQARGVRIERPIPIEDIVEKHLKLHVEFDDLHRLFGAPRGPDSEPDIFGAIFFEEGRLFSIRASTRKWIPVGRISIGAPWRMRAVVIGACIGNCSRRVLPLSLAPRPWFAVPVSEANALSGRLNFHASCTLMPKDLVTGTWHARFGSTRPNEHEGRGGGSLPDDQSKQRGLCP
jgi:hypothetical protein